MYVIRLLELASGGRHWASGQYVASYNPVPPPSGPYNGGDLRMTTDPSKALTFASAAEAMGFWKIQAPPPYHLRLDGRPNRPLTAFTAELVGIPEPEKRKEIEA